MKLHKIVLRVLFFTVAISSFMGSTAWADTVMRVICPHPFEVKVTKARSGNIISCSRWITLKKPKKEYHTYVPCKSPGRYSVRDEISSGSSRGTDRCTIGGFTGPSLPCAMGRKREIVRNGRDKCYKLITRDIERSQFRVCRDRERNCTY